MHFPGVRGVESKKSFHRCQPGVCDPGGVNDSGRRFGESLLRRVCRYWRLIEHESARYSRLRWVESEFIEYEDRLGGPFRDDAEPRFLDRPTSF